MKSFFELDTPRHTPLNTTAGDYTRYVRLMAAVAPYVQSGKVIAAPTLGWKTNELNAQVRLIAPIYGQLNSFIPNRR